MIPDTPVVEPALLDALRDDLGEAGFTVAGVETALGPVAAAALHRSEAVPALRAVARGTDASLVLAGVFMLGRAVRRRALAQVLPRLGVAGAERLGLVVAAGQAPDDEVRALVDLRPYAAVDGRGEASWWVASDLGEMVTGGPLRTDHVLGIGGASTLLAQVTVRGPRGRALDLGTGCGVQALHAGRHCDEVVGTDISARALAFAAFNAALAGARLDLRQGSLFEPVTGERFDLVVSNPPFVITPRAAGVPEYEYRDAGRTGDSLVRDLVLRVGDVLAPGGVAQLLGNWELHDDEGWTDRVGAWVDASGLDAWVVQRDLLDPAQYAELWIRDAGTTPDGSPRVWRDRYEAWLDDFAARGVTAVGLGILTLRRPESVDDERRDARAGRGVGGAATEHPDPGPGAGHLGDGPSPSSGTRLRRLEEATGSVAQPLGPAIAAGLAAHDWLASRDDSALADERLVVAGDVTEERYLRPGDDDPRVVLLRQGSGFGRAVGVGTALAGLVGACDGELSVGRIVGALGSLLDEPADTLAGELLPAVRGLVFDGLLLPVR